MRIEALPANSAVDAGAHAIGAHAIGAHAIGVAQPGTHARPAAPPHRALPVTGGPVSSPPPALPLTHFAFALAWLTVASVMLPWVAPALARGEVFQPAALALVHVLTLGVVGSAIAGALQQFVPGALGVPLRSIRVGWWGLWMFEAGVVVLVLGMGTWHGALQGLGWTLVLGGVGCVSTNVLRARRRSVHGKQVGLFITVGHSALGAGMGLAAARIGETLGWWHLDRLHLLAAHALLGAAGFGTLTAMGVGSRMIPTFLGAPGDGRRWLDAIVRLIGTGLAVFTLGALTQWWWATHFGGAMLAAGGATCVALAVAWLRRKTRDTDETALHVLSAFTALAVATGMGVWLLLDARIQLAHWAALLAALILGWLVTLTVGVQSKIASHLGIPLWRRMFGVEHAPTPVELRAAEAITLSVVLLTAGWMSLVVSLLAGSGTAARASSVVWGLGAVVAATAPAFTLTRVWMRAERGRASAGRELPRQS